MAARVLKTEDSGIVWLTLSDPKTRNALDFDSAAQFSKIIKELKNRDDLKVVVLQGADPAFCSGGDHAMLKNRSDYSIEDNEKAMLDFYRSFLEIRNLPCPTVSLIRGPAMGAGFCLALACDLRWIQKGSRVGLNFAQLGLAPGMAASALLAENGLADSRRAELLFRGKILDAQEAWNWGLVGDVFEISEWTESVPQAISKLAALPSFTREAMVQGLRQYRNADCWEATLARDSRAQALCFAMPSWREQFK